ncbi:DNA-directed RNA polymerase subunit D [Candidatus Mancarchaeum acidiphilum]|uniref:DNA-directed RNA polymerase subunit Rpo3 n=1 Tax=Candidatus Mancarchaeum acidiphilum TaxID=1920749 RepID=A0A218NLL7_9ARCH|nr:DNA-directed RNA polymerase subunit D [Candidatus Mancarchaeum acidiphilum]ASI13360.1 DNA-directed RNA polymerase subunit D [Candidatus Mancarchaeum acidiphilum]
MDIDISQNNNKVFEFTLAGVSNAFANAIRRVAMNGVKSFAIDKVTFYENSSAMFDEYIAHRIGLVPITTPSGYKDTDEVMFTLEAEGPLTVYSNDLKTTEPDVKVAIENIPIMKLAEKQRLRIDGKAVLGSAVKHAKFQPGLVTYEQMNDNSFKFYIESFGQMLPKDIIIRALDILEDEIKSISKISK